MNKVTAGVLAVALLLSGASVAWGNSKDRSKAQDKGQQQTQPPQGNSDGLSGIGALGVTWE